MSAETPGAVFDCNVSFQAMISGNGPAARCLQKVHAGDLTLFISDYVLAEIRDLPNDAEIAAKFNLTVEKAEAFIGSFIAVARHCQTVPAVYRHPYDPSDSHYVNLALATATGLAKSGTTPATSAGRRLQCHGRIGRHPSTEIVPCDCAAKREACPDAEDRTLARRQSE
jgi:predicted nucleic acid-binding protein